MKKDGSPCLHLPLVSIVVISYNHIEFLGDCLNSLCAQTYPNIEIIIVDNCSTDGSRPFIEEFIARPRGNISWRLIASVTNTYLTGAMFQGFSNVNGSFLIFLDGDDYLLPTCVAAHISAQMASRIAVGATSVDMYHSRGREIVVPTGKTLARYVMSGAGTRPERIRMESLIALELEICGSVLKEADLHFVDRYTCREWVWSPTSGLCFRRELVELMFSYRPNIQAGTDNYLIRGITALTGSITIDRALAVYRMHDSNMFTKHPPIENIVSFEKDQLLASDQSVCEEIINCYKHNAISLAARLENVDIFIEAVEVISQVGAGLSPADTPYSYTACFIRQNVKLLEVAFGTKVVQRWKRRYNGWAYRGGRAKSAIMLVFGRS